MEYKIPHKHKRDSRKNELSNTLEITYKYSKKKKVCLTEVAKYTIIRSSLQKRLHAII